MRQPLTRTETGAILLLLAVAGCGSSGGRGPGDPVSSDEASQICADFMVHATACGWGNNINEADWNCGEAAVVWRADVFWGVAACGTDLDCAASGAPCVLLAFDAAPLAIHQDYAVRCQSRKTECGLVPSGDTQQVLLSCNADALAAYTDPVMESILTCFDAACADVGTCLDSTL